MTEDKKTWQISEVRSSGDCRWQKPAKPDLSGGKFNNFGEVLCNHERYKDNLCSITRKEFCPLLHEPQEIEYPMDPKLQVSKDDV